MIFERWNESIGLKSIWSDFIWCFGAPAAENSQREQPLSYIFNENYNNKELIL